MSDMADTQELARLLLADPKSADPARLMQGVIAGIDLVSTTTGIPKGTVTVYISGGSTYPVGNVRYFSHYTPKVGDTVWLVKNGPDLMVLGKLKDKVTSDAEAWRVVGSAGQPAFQNAWTNFGGGHATVAFYKDQSGVVHLRGMIKATGAGAEMFTLPVGYRPLSPEYFPVISNDNVALVSITSTGVVALNQGSNAWVSLDAITFLAQSDRDDREEEMVYGYRLNTWVVSAGMSDGRPAVWRRDDNLCIFHRGGLNGGAVNTDAWRVPSSLLVRDHYLYQAFGWNGAAVAERLDLDCLASAIHPYNTSDVRFTGVRWFCNPFDTSNWIPVTAFSNAWVNFAATGQWRGASYYKDKYGVVHLHGLVKSGNFGDFAMFTLPVGYRPGSRLLFPAQINNGICRLEARTDGTVRPVAQTGGTNAFLSLDNVTFRAEG